MIWIIEGPKLSLMNVQKRAPIPSLPTSLISFSWYYLCFCTMDFSLSLLLLYLSNYMTTTTTTKYSWISIWTSNMNSVPKKKSENSKVKSTWATKAMSTGPCLWTLPTSSSQFGSLYYQQLSLFTWILVSWKWRMWKNTCGSREKMVWPNLGIWLLQAGFALGFIWQLLL